MAYTYIIYYNINTYVYMFRDDNKLSILFLCHDGLKASLAGPPRQRLLLDLPPLLFPCMT